MESDNLVKEETSLLLKSLTDNEKEKLKKQDSRPVSQFLSNKLETEAKKYWDQFYKRNKTNFFKDRHWTTREFKELAGSDGEKLLLEIGCGVGNLVYPLLEEKLGFKFYACDFSPRAVEFVKSHQNFNPDLVVAFQADVTDSNALIQVPPVDLITLVFVMSAIHPDKFTLVIKNLYTALKPGGVVLFRDYGIYDMAQLRFKPGNKISENFYMRQDGTRSYFFTLEKVDQIFTQNGFITIDNTYVHRRTINKKENLNVPRIFVQGKFQKAVSTT